MLAVTFSARLEEVDGAVVALRNAAAKCLPESALVRLEIAVSEALTNIVRHGDASPAATIEASCQEHGDGVVVTISDTGRPAPENLFREASLPEDPFEESGRGIALILSCADSVGYHTEAGRNELSMVFRSVRVEPCEVIAP